MIGAIRAWAERHTSDRRYSPVGQVFHWVMAALICFQLYWGWSMTRLPVGGDKLAAYDVHAALGLLMLVLAALRGLWRLIVPGPINDADKPGWQSVAAQITHVLFYTIFFGLPLSGWAMWSALDGAPDLYLAGVVAWPQMPFDAVATDLRWWILDWSETTHMALILLLVVMIPLHVGAALKHHFWDRHDVLLGMLPDLPEDAVREEPRHMRQDFAAPRPSAGG